MQNHPTSEESVPVRHLRLSALKTSEVGLITKVFGHGSFRNRITEMGFIRGKIVKVIKNAPLQDPVEYEIMGYRIALRHSEAELIEVMPISELPKLKLETDSLDDFKHHRSHHQHNRKRHSKVWRHLFGRKPPHHHSHDAKRAAHTSHEWPGAIRSGNQVINVALVGNPNSGKTSLFNLASGSHERVGNYSGVTVDAKTARFHQGHYTFNLVDLPGTYSITEYTPEELYVRTHILREMPDVVINVVDATNLERNLFLTTQLIDMDIKVVIALNMYDEMEQTGARLDYEHLGRMLGIPIVPTVASQGTGIRRLFDTVAKVFEDKEPTVRHIHINYGTDLEEAIGILQNKIWENSDIVALYSSRYLAIKLLEGDQSSFKLLEKCANFNDITKTQALLKQKLEKRFGENPESAIADAKYGFIVGALEETYQGETHDKHARTGRIDRIMTDKIWGLPVFLLLMWVMFQATFTLGAIPAGWIESGVSWLSDTVTNLMAKGSLRNLIVDGIISGVGGVIVFLPNILILFFFISLMEDTGYMARAAFIMDKLMHKIGLHGKSFIPLVMGFGCNVPAIMATRTIESRSSRLITVLITPFMSCSARLPIYILFVGTFFPDHGGLVLFGLYLLGIALAVVTARLMRRFLYKVDETPFVMELPPYRMPTMRATLSHMWDKSAQYLRKMGGLILVASLFVWFLSYFPRPVAGEPEIEHYENSYLGQLGRWCEPAVEPLGLNWKAGVAILSGVSAKEIVVSTLGVLYSQDATADDASLAQTLRESGDFTPASALAFLVFVLLYFPCIATIVAVRNEAGRGWALASMVYSTAVAWFVAWIVYHIALLL